MLSFQLQEQVRLTTKKPSITKTPQKHYIGL